jgi:F0F1-type ATP synthase assembly protein I
MWRLAAETGAVGVEIAVAIALGYLGGTWLDEKFHSTPWLKWIGFAAGLGASVKALARVTRKYKKSLEQDDD